MGFNDTSGVLNETVVQKIKYAMIHEDSTKQIDAIWFVHNAGDTRCHLQLIFNQFRNIIGEDLTEISTLIIT